MKILIDELKNNFGVKQLSTNEASIRLTTELFDTHDKAVDALIKLLQDKGYTEITLPYMPPPYIVDDREGNYQGVISLIE